MLESPDLGKLERALRAVALDELRRLGMMHEDISDLVQGTYAALLARGLSLDGAAIRLGRCLIRRRCADLARRSLRDALPGSRPWSEGVERGADGVVEAAARMAWLAAEIEGLRPRDRMVLLAVMVEGRSQTAVARELGVSVQAVNFSLAKTLKRLRERASAADWRGESSHCVA